MVDGNGLIYGSDFQYREKLFQTFCNKDVLIPQEMIQKFFLISCVVPNMSAAIIKKNYFKIVDGFDPMYKACADWDFWGRITEHCDFYYVSKALNNFRNHPTTVRNISGIQTSSLEIFDILYKRFSAMNLNYSEKLKFKMAIGSVWGSQAKLYSIKWLKSFPYVWLHSLKYDYFIILYLFLWITRRSYEKILQQRFFINSL